jgi:hypothetical protein
MKANKSRPSGFFDLRTPVDLAKKMDLHFQQLSADPLNVYAAFDFFVAAEHLPEWLNGFGCGPGRRDPRAHAMQKVCSHLANGAKHFAVKPGKHSAIRATTVSTPAIAGLARSGITLSGAVRRKLMILLEADEAAALGVDAISAVTLAQMILTYWREHPAMKRAATKLSAKTGEDPS